MDSSSLVVSLVTLLLLVGALFSKGFTHDLFLETGIFLVSVKVILCMSQGTRLCDPD